MAFVALIMTMKLPVTVGVPLISPVVVLTDSPAGRPVAAKMVGEFIAAHSCPIALRDGTLYVHVLQPALHYELDRVNKPEILRKLKQRYGGRAIRDLRFRLG